MVPEGTVHVYPVAPEVGLIEYVADAPLQKVEGPVIFPAAEGVDVIVIGVELVFVHPFAPVPVTIYVVVETGTNDTPFDIPPDHE